MLYNCPVTRSLIPLLRERINANSVPKHMLGTN